MKTLDVAILVALAACAAQPLAASDFVVVAATGALEPEGLEAGQELPGDTRLALEPWGRALIRETGGCGLTHVVIGVGEYVLAPSEDCSPTAEPNDVAQRLQRGEAFAEVLKETGSGPADELSSARVNEPCVFMRPVSEEGENVGRGASGHAVRGLRCGGKFCDA